MNKQAEHLIRRAIEKDAPFVFAQIIEGDDGDMGSISISAGVKTPAQAQKLKAAVARAFEDD